MNHKIYTILCQNKRTKRFYVKWGYTADSLKRRIGRLKASYKNLFFFTTECYMFETYSADVEKRIFEFFERKGIKPIYKKEFYSPTTVYEYGLIKEIWGRP